MLYIGVAEAGAVQPRKERFELCLQSSECDELSRIISSYRGRRGPQVESLLDDELTAILKSRQNCYIGPNTFFPEQEGFDSPFLAAIKYNNVDALRFFISHFGELINIDHLCTCVRNVTRSLNVMSEVLHECTPLHAACYQLYEGFSSIDVVKFLVLNGASVNAHNCRHSTPLMLLGIPGNLSVMKYLVKKGAVIDAENLTGNTALCAAAIGGHTEAVKYLIKKGANVNHQNVTGHSPLHYAALMGHLQIVNTLLYHGASPYMLYNQDSSQSDYVAPPVLMAAFQGHTEVVNKFLDLSECPTKLKVDALLLLGASGLKHERRGAVTPLISLWRRAFKLKEECTEQWKYLSPIEAYGNQTEITTVTDYEQLLGGQAFQPALSDVLKQVLIMSERCLGLQDQWLIHRIATYAQRLLSVQPERYPEVELLWVRMLEGLTLSVTCKPPHILPHLFSHSFFPLWQNYIDLLYTELRIRTLECTCQPNYKPFVEFGMKGLGFLKKVSTSDQHQCKTPDPTTFLSFLLKLFCLWLLQQECQQSVSQDNDGGVIVFSEEYNSLGHELVSSHRQILPNSTLIHAALGMQIEVPITQRHVSQLVSALLNWGAHVDINARGLTMTKRRIYMRPIHLAVLRANKDAVSVLLENGAHLDAVDGKGRKAVELRPYLGEIQELLQARIPLPLSCQACHAVVREAFPYTSLNFLPTHVKGLIQLHHR